MEHRPFCCSVKGFVKMLRLDILNSLVAAIFMIIISVLALIPETTKYTVLGGVFGLLAVVCCIADAALIYRKLLFNPSGPYQKKAIHDEI
ncbi:PREDICTED: chemokine-like factor isoform X4 [Myotis brandtii]|uniref:chemokine-like factor isoform X4 n=1 Tax=Myotis brandtii TaxID=109478 RepID=UPI0006D708D6|nr:PREDICTED: chemokine-like factor isoform X4 [Myotis brandtii]